MSNIIKQHIEPEKPLVYEPPDLVGRKHVEKITGEFRYREDECLADKLQSEEFNKYFESNKLARKLGKMDIDTAKAIFLKEVEQSGLLTSSQLKELCSNDSLFAEELTRRIEREMDTEAERKIVREMQDEEFARYLQLKERKKLAEEKKIKLQRKLAEERQLQLLHQEDEETASMANQIGYKFIIPESANQLEESERLTEEEKKRIEEENDRWIAIRLQNEEALEYKRARSEKLRRKRECNAKKDGAISGENIGCIESGRHTYNSKVLNTNTHSSHNNDNRNYRTSQFSQVDNDQLEPQTFKDEHIYLKAIDVCQDMDQLPNDNIFSFKDPLKYNQLCNKLDEASFGPVSNGNRANQEGKSRLTQVSNTIYDPDNPIPVRNVKRSSVKGEKNKKKWFSAK